MSVNFKCVFMVLLCRHTVYCRSGQCSLACGLVSIGCLWGIAAAVDSASIDRCGRNLLARRGSGSIFVFLCLLVRGHLIQVKPNALHKNLQPQHLTVNVSMPRGHSRHVVRSLHDDASQVVLKFHHLLHLLQLNKEPSGWILFSQLTMHILNASHILMTCILIPTSAKLIEIRSWSQ